MDPMLNQAEHADTFWHVESSCRGAYEIIQQATCVNIPELAEKRHSELIIDQDGSRLYRQHSLLQIKCQDRPELCRRFSRCPQTSISTMPFSQHFRFLLRPNGRLCMQVCLHTQTNTCEILPLIDLFLKDTPNFRSLFVWQPAMLTELLPC